MLYETILCEKQGNVAIVTLNRPEKLNTITPAVLNELSYCFNELRYDLDVRCVILASSGRAFSAGGDINFESECGPKEISDFQSLAQSCLHKIETFRVPVIVAINGYALGGGAELAIMGDYLIAAEDAQIGWPEIKLSAIPTWSAVQKLPKMIGVFQTRKILYTGEFIKAQNAKQLGLVGEVVPAEELMPTALTLANKIASYPPLAMETLKRALYYGDAFDVEEPAFLRGTEDSKEAYSAFLEKREPKGYNRR